MVVQMVSMKELDWVPNLEHLMVSMKVLMMDKYLAPKTVSTMVVQMAENLVKTRVPMTVPMKELDWALN